MARMEQKHEILELFEYEGVFDAHLSKDMKTYVFESAPDEWIDIRLDKYQMTRLIHELAHIRDTMIAP
jgi:hypothetical protein